MTRTEYESQVNKVLGQFTDKAVENLRQVFVRLPEKAVGVSLEIFVDQDGEGFLSVEVSLSGPDLYVLNKEIERHALLFGTTMTKNGLVPSLPLMDPSHREFDVADVLTDCAVSWLLTAWRKANVPKPSIPVTIESHDGLGSHEPISLN